MERRVLMEAAPERRALLADAPAEGVALPEQGELDLGLEFEVADEFQERVRRFLDANPGAGELGALYDVMNVEMPPPGWAMERVIYDRTMAFGGALGLPVDVLLPGIVKMTDWSRELPPTRGWWLVREQPGGEVSVLWFERVGRPDDGSWHLEGDGSDGFPKGQAGLCLGMHGKLTNIEWCGLAEPWPGGYTYHLDAAHEDALAAKNKADAAEWMAAGGFIKRRALLELS